VRRYLIFLPSIALGLLGTIWLYFRPFPYAAKFNLWILLLIATMLVLLLLGGAYILERFVPSFRYASKMLERALKQFRINLPFAFLLATFSSLSEEIFFRGALLPLIGVWGQALLFGLMHPAPRKAWVYTFYTFIAGLAFGYATLLTGSLIPGIVTHFVINLHGFLEIRQVNNLERFKQP
jgi:membrane protease YdiL (CAAX protease family)